MRILLISGHFPHDLFRTASGTFKRLDTIIGALTGIASLDILFFAGRDTPITEAQRAQFETEMSEHWECDIHISICPPNIFKDDTVISRWLSYAGGIFSFYNQQGKKEYCGKKQIQAVRKCLERGPDVIFAHRIGPMSSLTLIKDIALPPIVFDLDDIEHIVLRRYIRHRKNLKSNFLALLLPELKRGEYEAVKMATKTFVCSEKDAQDLTEEFKLPGIVAVPNSIEIPALEPLTQEPVLLYLSSGYWPNMQAAENLVNNIWPLVIEEIPDAKLIIAGKYKERFNFMGKDIPGLEIPGFVDDLDELYRGARATAVPLLIGGGTRFKIIEAAMYGKPTVATSVGAEGLELEDKKEILIEDTTESFASACIKLLSDEQFSQQIGISARKKAIKLYDSKQVTKVIQYHTRECVNDSI